MTSTNTTNDPILDEWARDIRRRGGLHAIDQDERAMFCLACARSRRRQRHEQRVRTKQPQPSSSTRR